MALLNSGMEEIYRAAYKSLLQKLSQIGDRFLKSEGFILGDDSYHPYKVDQCYQKHKGHMTGWTSPLFQKVITEQCQTTLKNRNVKYSVVARVISETDQYVELKIYIRPHDDYCREDSIETVRWYPSANTFQPSSDFVGCIFT